MHQLYIDLEMTEHAKTMGRDTKWDGICESLHRTMQEDCFAEVTREKLYDTLELLQADFDEWPAYYNNERWPTCRYYYGKTPKETFEESLPLAK